MIPRQLTLKNFLSYRQATLDFRGLHVACISGPNGAGKSSLLEAISWVIWGQCRVAVDDDIIHAGELEAQVDFWFEHGQQTYRILRCRRRGQSSTLEFQMQTAEGLRVLTQRGVRTTQQLICQHLKLDYETFLNSAYLRQGRADEFMVKRPSDRKQILADLLKLDQYDRLAERAKDKSREAKAQITLLKQQIQGCEEQLQQRGALVQTQRELQTLLTDLEAKQAILSDQIFQLRQQQQQRQQWQQQRDLLLQQQANMQQSLDRLQAEAALLEQQWRSGQAILQQADCIHQSYAELQRLQAAEAQQAEQFQVYQTLQTELGQLQQTYSRRQQALAEKQQQIQLQQAAIDEQLQEIEPLLAKATQVQTALGQLQTAKGKLQMLDRLQLKVAPLLQRRQELLGKLQQTQARIQAKLEELTTSEQQIHAQQAQRPQIMQAVLEVTQTLSYLEQRRAYQAQVREKGLERRSFMDQLQANQRTYEAQLADLDHKLRLLAEPNAVCPLCDRPLDEHHWALVQERHRLKQQEIQDQIWVIREQLAVSEREIQVLRQEYRDLETELAQYAPVLQQQGHLTAQIHTQTSLQGRLQQLEAERQQLEACLSQNTYAADLQSELAQLDRTLADLNYDDRNHALVRGQVDRLRWAEIKQAEIDQACRRRERLLSQQPRLQQQLQDLESDTEALAQSPLHQQIQALECRLADTGYQFEQHQQLRQQLQAAQSWQTQHQALLQAQQEAPSLEQRRTNLHGLIQAQTQKLADLNRTLKTLQVQLQEHADAAEHLSQLEQQLRDQRQSRDQIFSKLGALQQQLEQLEQVQTQLDAHQQALSEAQRQTRVHQELAYAFGRNGIQALMIENVLPQLEAETNHLLGRLSNHQLHVQFVTQRASRSRQGKLIDTLDILIADAKGTRPYETYSGGESFRVNFAIRLALARLLAQRSGMALQLLIIDEGFGTQDQEGCQRLIGAINTIAPDFACILTVTHIPHFREAFQTRIDVVKREDGSQLSFSA